MLGAKMAKESLLQIVLSWAKLVQLGPKLVQVGLTLVQVGVSDASLDVQVHEMWFRRALGAQPGPT